MSRLRRLRPKDLGAFLKAWAILLAVDLDLRLTPFERLEKRWAARRRTGSRGLDESAVRRAVWATAAAARHHVYPMRCLPRALCLRWLLGRLGVVSELKIGVAKGEGRLEAHAWVERDGRPLGDGADVGERFAVLD